MLNEYQKLIKDGLLKEDQAQAGVVPRLHFYSELIQEASARPSISKLFSKKAMPCAGMYLHGSVGRGKSYLMSLFFDHTPIANKKKVHFHYFMQEFHKKLHDVQSAGIKDPVYYVAKQMSDKLKLLCFDELQINNIADAMLVGRLFKALLELGIFIVITSNRHPDGLFENGLQRERFVPFIEMVKEKFEVISLDGAYDYRAAKIRSVKESYYVGSDKKAFLENIYEFILEGHDWVNRKISTEYGREILVLKTYGKAAAFSFMELCGMPLSAADYMAICHNFSTIVIEDIPKLGHENHNEALRFITLIDCLYESKSKLICTAECLPEQLYQDGKNSFEFVRTASRLIEMQSESYIQ